jgi:hypothetical protein
VLSVFQVVIEVCFVHHAEEEACMLQMTLNESCRGSVLEMNNEVLLVKKRMNTESQIPTNELRTVIFTDNEQIENDTVVIPWKPLNFLDHIVYDPRLSHDQTAWSFQLINCAYSGHRTRRNC